MRIGECFKKRLLRQDKPDMLKSTKALEMTNLKIKRAVELFEKQFYEEVVTN
jgi:hypothetical protein